MGAYLIRRLLLMVLTLFGMSVLIFVMLRLVPGNITDIIFDSAGFVNPAKKAAIERQLGLDQPIVIQYANWIAGLARGDLGYAFVSEKPALDEILPRIPVTAKLAEDLARPIIYYRRSATCWQPQLKGFTLHHNSIYNNWRFEDVWLDK